VHIYWKIGFVVVISTFITYLLNLLTMKNKTNNRCCFIYFQPVLPTVFAIGLGKDELSMVKIISAILIFVGVYL
jgi:cyclic lactone autoinducer peptide